MDTTQERGSVVGRAVGIVLLIAFFVAMLAIIAALTFSVRVEGHSMEPTLHDGDRLSTNFFGRDQVHRFDLVKTAAGKGGIQVVKRVIGMPGDQVAIEGDLKQPTVLVKVHGQGRARTVHNPAWIGRTGDRTQACCAADGTAIPGIRPHWITVPAEHYWLLGDNYGKSDDSRVFGMVTQDEIGATLDFRILPMKRFGSIPDRVRLRPAGS